LISQKTPGSVVKVGFERGSAGYRDRRLPLGETGDEPHGLAVSRRHPRLVWVTLEHATRSCCSIHGQSGSPRARTSSVGSSSRPERTDRATSASTAASSGSPCRPPTRCCAWTHANRASTPSTRRRPIRVFIAQHPRNGDFYASIDESSEIVRISPGTGRTRLLDTTASDATRPVARGGSRSPAARRAAPAHSRAWTPKTRSRRTDSPPLVADAALLHLAFGAPRRGRPASIRLLSSSIVDPAALDVVVRAALRPAVARSPREVAGACRPSDARPTASCCSGTRSWRPSSPPPGSRSSTAPASSDWQFTNRTKASTWWRPVHSGAEARANRRCRRHAWRRFVCASRGTLAGTELRSERMASWRRRCPRAGCIATAGSSASAAGSWRSQRAPTTRPGRPITAGVKHQPRRPLKHHPRQDTA
jgi:virginiamycin B lyase